MTTKKVYNKLKEFNTIWHAESKFVFKSEKDRKVIGRLNDERQIDPFTYDMIEECERLGFDYDESLLETEPPEDTDELESNNEDTLKEPETKVNVPIPETKVPETKVPEETNMNAPSYDKVSNRINDRFTKFADNVVTAIVELEDKNSSLASENARLQSELENMKRKIDSLKQLFS